MEENIMLGIYPSMMHLTWYHGYQTYYVAGTATKDDKTMFHDAILHPVYSLRVCVLTNPSEDNCYVVLTLDNRLGLFLSQATIFR